MAAIKTWVMALAAVKGVSVCIHITVKSHKRHGISNHRQIDYLFNSFLGLTSAKTPKLGNIGPLRGESAGDWWIFLAKGQLCGKCFHVMASLWQLFCFCITSLKFVISIKISLNFIPKGAINNQSWLIRVMAWRRTGDKPLSEPMFA